MCSNFFKENKWVLFLESVKKIAVIVQYIVQYAYKMHDFFSMLYGVKVPTLEFLQLI